ncbi:MAG: hypothetical protein N3G18_06545 [Candidatus Saccharicenans sp.]|nr:hypothetical protein [Candidatus Saccharicenans sp.]
MIKRLFLFITPDGVTYSSYDLNEPDVDNFQVLGYGEGENEDEAFQDFKSQNQWLMNTEFDETICIEIKHRICEGKCFRLKDNKEE